MPTIDERELEDFLMEDIGNLYKIGIEPGNFANVYRQFNLGGYGRPDIIVIDPTPGPDGEYWFDIHVVELKKDALDVGALMQGYRYVAGLRHHLTECNPGAPVNFHFYVTLVGGSINESDWVYLGQMEAGFRVFTYDLSLSSGINFREHSLYGYRATKPNFNPQFEQLITIWKQAYIDSVDEHKAIMAARQKALPAPLVRLSETIPASAEGDHGATA